MIQFFIDCIINCSSTAVRSFVRSVGWLVNHKMQLKLSQERVSIAAICCPNIHTSNLDASGASVWVSYWLLVGSCAWTGCLLLH